MQFAANLSTLFSAQTPFEERCRAVAKQQFKAVEILFPYAAPIESYVHPLQQHGLEAILINTPNEAGEFGYAALPGKEQAFQSAFDIALEVGQALGVKAIHVMGGNLTTGTTKGWEKTLYNNMSKALRQVQGTGIMLQLEALNRIDVPQYAYSDPLELLPIIKELDHPQVGLQFDFYHTLMQGYDLLKTLEQCLPYISHVQIACPSGRHEPDFSQYPVLLEGLNFLADVGYQGWVGLEYSPQGTFEESLGFLQSFTKQSTTR